MSAESHENLVASPRPIANSHGGEPAPSGKASSWWAGVASAVALPTVLASLFGYGVLMGIAMAVGLDHGSLINGPFDLLTLIWPGALMLMTTMGRGEFWQVLLHAIQSAFWVGVGLGVATLIAILAVRLLRHKQRGERAVGWARQHVKRGVSLWKLPILPVLVFLLTVLVTPVVQVLGAMAIVAVFVFAMTIPMLGYTTGQAFVHEMVLRPSVCASTPGFAAREQAKSREKSKQVQATAPEKDRGIVAVQCVALTSSDTSKPYLKAGRLVIATAHQALLWDPVSGRADLVPLAGMTMTTIDQATFESLLPHATPLQAQPVAEARSEAAP